MWWILGVLGLIVVFIVILLIRTLLFKPPAVEASKIEEVAVDTVAVGERLAQMIRCKTVSSLDESKVDKGEFEKFRALLGELYPRVHSACELERLGSSGILYTLKGLSSAAPVVFMAHYDVVPVDQAAWAKPAFDGIVEDGALWGRGTLDTKATLCGVMEAAENLLAQGFVSQNDLYFAFSGDEEIAGDSAPAIVDEFEKRGVVPGLVLDEGGAVIGGVFPGVSQPCALIGTAEKGMLDLEISLEGKGGHASTPPPHTLVGQLAQAVTRIEAKPFKSRLTPPVATMFDTLGRHSSFVYRLIFANLWCFSPVLDAICRKQGGELNAMMRTTCAFTMMGAGTATNVLPSAAKITANLRIIGGETTESAIAYLQMRAGDPLLRFESIYGMNPSRISVTEGAGWETLRTAVAQTWTNALVSPYLMFACSDSRHYGRISDRVYRFSAMELSKAELGMIHGHNERIPLSTLAKTVEFYIRLMRSC